MSMFNVMNVYINILMFMYIIMCMLNCLIKSFVGIEIIAIQPSELDVNFKQVYRGMMCENAISK